MTKTRYRIERSIVIVVALIFFVGFQAIKAYAAEPQSIVPQPEVCTSLYENYTWLDWSEVEGAEGYRIYSSVNGHYPTFIFDFLGPLPRTHWEEFQNPEATYVYYVSAVIGGIGSELTECTPLWSTPTTTTTTTVVPTTTTTTTTTKPAPVDLAPKCTDRTPLSAFVDFELTVTPSDNNSLFRAYCITLFRYPDVEGFNYWLDIRQAGLSWQFISATMADSVEFRMRYGRLSDTEFVERVYVDVLQRGSDKDGLAYWTGLLTSKALDRGEILFQFSDSTEFKIQTGTA